MAGWKRTYWAVWTANLITAIGMMSFLPFFPSHVESLGVTDRAEIAAWAGLIYGAAPFAAAIMAPVWGALGDRIGRRRMIVRAMAAIFVFVGLMAFARTPAQLLVLRLAQGVFSGFVAPSVTLVSVAAPAEQQGRIAGSLQTALALGAVIGPAIGGLVGPRFGVNSLFLAVAGLSLVAAGLVLWLTHEDVGHRQARVTGEGPLDFARGMLRDLVGIWQNRAMRAALVLVFLVQFGTGATNPLLELFVGDLLGEGVSSATAAQWTGALFSAMAVVNIVALPRWGGYGDRRGHARGLALCAGATAFALVLHALATNLALLFAARMLLGASVAGAGPLAFGLAAAEIPVERRGGAFGAVFSARTLAISTAAAGGGFASAFIGLRGLFLVGAGLVLLSFTGLRRSPKQDERPSPASRPDAPLPRNRSAHRP